jgi:hypothetical protein
MIDYEGEHEQNGEFGDLLDLVDRLPRYSPPPQVLVRVRSRIVFRRRMNRLITFASALVVVGAGLTAYTVVQRGSEDVGERNRLIAEHAADKARSLNVALNELEEMEREQPAFSPLLVGAKRRVHREQRNTMDQLTGYGGR